MGSVGAADFFLTRLGFTFFGCSSEITTAPGAAVVGTSTSESGVGAMAYAEGIDMTGPVSELFLVSSFRRFLFDA